MPKPCEFLSIYSCQRGSSGPMRELILHVIVSLSKSILQGTLKVGQCYALQMKCLIDNIKEWISLPMPELPTMAFCTRDWRRISGESSLMFLGHR